MKILFVAAEVGPFVSVGGLSQVMYFLPNALGKLGHDVRIFTPKYGLMDSTHPSKKSWPLRMEYEGLKVPINEEYVDTAKGEDSKSVLICNIKSYRKRKTSPLVYFLENREYYELRANVFAYTDDHVRFGLLSRGCLEWLLKLKKMKDSWVPDIINCNDWHTSYLADYGKRDKRYKENFIKTTVILTIHNFRFQGNYDFRYAHDEDRDDGIKPLAPLLAHEFQKQNALLRGLLYADGVNTVSPTHALEVLTPEYAEGLEENLQNIRSKLIGILNGLDTQEFNPAHDPLIKKKFNKRFFISARRENKKEIQKLFFLPEDPNRPLLVSVGRISQQKGWDLMLSILPKLLAVRPNLQLVVLGKGEDHFQNELQKLQNEFPEQIGLHLRSDFRLPRKLFAGADMVLMPSLFEPGGIVAFEALRYGAVPIVRRTGGLNDIIEDFNPTLGRGNGFSFKKNDPWELYAAIIEALTIYRQPSLWKTLVKNCMKGNYSWADSAKKYNEWYEDLIEEKKRAVSIVPHPAYTISSLE